MKYDIVIEYGGTKRMWFYDNKTHREDGPAIEWAGGAKFWYLNGECLTEAQFNARKA